MKLEKIDTVLYIQPGAPVPVVLSDEYNLSLFYYYDKFFAENITVDMPVERNSNEDKGIAHIKFDIYLIYKFGYPNVEVLQSHPYYHLGLEPYNIFEVVESDWVKEIEIRNRVHPFHNRLRYLMYKHFIITFEDSTFECIARGLEISFFQNLTMKEALKTFSENFIKFT